MKQLPVTFERNGFVFSRLNREGQVALYKRKAKSFTYEDYEIIRVRSLQFEEGELSEVYPTADVWGTFGITKTILEEAEEEFKLWSGKYKDSEVEPFNPAMPVNHTRGRKPLNITLTFPEGDWTVQELADNHNVSTGYINVHLKPLLASGAVVKVDARKTTSGRGKRTNYYVYNSHARHGVNKSVKSGTKKVAEKA